MKHLLFCVIALLLSTSIYAQSAKENQKVYTYEQAVEVLKEAKGEFVEKGSTPTVGEQIHLIRKGKNVSLPTLAFITGLSKDILVKIEEDKIVPTREIIAKIEDFLGAEIILFQ